MPHPPTDPSPVVGATRERPNPCSRNLGEPGNTDLDRNAQRVSAPRGERGKGLGEHGNKIMAWRSPNPPAPWKSQPRTNPSSPWSHLWDREDRAQPRVASVGAELSSLLAIPWPNLSKSSQSQPQGLQESLPCNAMTCLVHHYFTSLFLWICSHMEKYFPSVLSLRRGRSQEGKRRRQGQG